MNIEELRNEIDSIDSQLIGLFEKRMNVAREIAQYKSENSLPVADKGRERDVLNRVTSCVSPEIEDYARSLYITVFELSRSYQKKLLGKKSALAEKIENTLENSPETMPERATVACQGVEGSYSSLAGEKLFKYPTVMFFKNFEGVFAAVDRGLCKYGVLPIENSNAGSVNEVYDLMNKYNFYITRSIKLWISHSLLVNEGAKLENIKEIFSHRQAIEQCSDFLSGLDGVKVTVCENTAVAAKKVRESKRTDVAAIGSKDCAEIYSLSELDSNIQNSDNNYTRFICISKNIEIYAGADKTSIVLVLPHKPGSLYNAISRFAALGLNLTKLESRPIEGSNFEFMFYFDIDASVYSPQLCTLISQLENDCEKFVYLGSYSEV
ncbi:MAG: bifunctional chorismate mutase/prephenate dehydratase [Clostridiales bacterium]|nr:bifunctional chorismate mutase/prephenate dehydratase [Clostridiales bacterium]